MKTYIPLVAAALATGACLTFEPVSAGEVSTEPLVGFEFSYPEDRVAELPGLAEQMATFGDSAERVFDELTARLTEIMPESPAPGNIQHSEQWSVVGEADALISLGATIYDYEGGAHGNTAYASLLWDVPSDRAVALTQLFTDRYAALAEIDSRYCPALLDMQRERGLGDGEWGDCPLLHEMTVIPTAAPGSSAFSAFTVLVPPYVAGPYSMGSFEIVIPVTEAILALLKPDYRNAFTLPTN